MRKHFITIFIIIFALYAFVNNPKKLSAQSSITEAPVYKFLEEAKSYLEVLLEDPSSTSLKGKDSPIIENQRPINKKNTAKKNTSRKDKKAKKQISDTNNKLSNVLYNVLHTSKGQELLEKVLFNPPIYNDNQKNKEPSPYHNNSSIDITQGDGDPAECGDTVKAHYIIRLVSGQEIENTYKSDEPTTFRIGDQQVIKGLEYAVIGMKKEGTRRIIVPPKIAYKQDKRTKGLVAGNEFVTIDVEVLDIKPLFRDWQSKIRIFENENIKNRPILCSDTVSFNYSISTGSGETIYKSKSSVGLILGNSSIPPAINKAFSNIRRGSKRSVILPSSLLYKQKIHFIPKNIKLPAKEVIILDININY
jgi:peptidylprolyl isomerase